VILPFKKIENQTLRKYDYNQAVTYELVMSRKYFHALLDHNNVFYSMEVCCFAIRMSLTIHFHYAGVSALMMGVFG
jgi:hypothetical protein